MYTKEGNMAHENLCCEKCGGALELKGNIYECTYCHSQFADIIIEKAYAKRLFSADGNP